MNSLNSIQFERDQMENTQHQETYSVEKQPPQKNLDSSSILLLTQTKARNEAQSPSVVSMQGNINKAFSKLIIYFHIAAFVKKLQRYLKPDSQFTESHYHLIQDKAAGNIKDFLAYIGKSRKVALQITNIDELTLSLKIRYSLRKIKRYCHQTATKVFDQLPLLDPNNKLKIIWDLLITCFRLYLIYLIPIILAFQTQMNELDLHLIIASFVFLIDMGFRCITIYYDQGLPVKDRYQILKNQYQVKTFSELAGILICFVFFVQEYDFKNQFILYEGWPKFLLLLYFFQIGNLLLYINSWQQTLSFGKAASSTIELIKLIGLILLLQHFCSCIWLILGQYQHLQGNHNWITANSIVGEWYDLYLESLYFISVTMFTVGYGDIHPVNQYEKVFSVIYMFLCTLQLSYSVNTIGHILTQIQKNNETIKKKFTFINQYMHNKKISGGLQFQVREYLNYYWYQEKIQQTKEQTEILGQLSEELRRAIAVESNGVVLSNCSYFNKFSKEFIDELLKHLHFVTYQPQTIIQTISYDFDFKINIIESGEVDVFETRLENHNGLKVGTLKMNDSFGIDEFLSSQRNDRLIYKSSGFVSVLVVERSLFLKILEKFPLDFETFWNLKQNFSDYYCASCESTRHNSDQCRQIHFVPEIEKVIKRYVFNQSQERSFFIRNRNRNKHYFNAHSDLPYIHEAANMLRIGNDSEIFQKYILTQEESTQNESNARVKLESDSLSLMLKEFESKSDIPLKSEQQIRPSITKNQEEQNSLIQLQQKLRQKSYYSDYDIEQIEETIRKLQIKLNQTLVVNDFEFHKEYTNFQPQNNLSTVVKRSISTTKKITYQTSKSLDNHQFSNLSTWLKYMFYPIAFFRQYRAIHRNQTDTDKITIVRRQQMKLSIDLSKKKRNNKRYIRRALQVFPIK